MSLSALHFAIRRTIVVYAIPLGVALLALANARPGSAESPTGDSPPSQGTVEVARYEKGLVRLWRTPEAASHCEPLWQSGDMAGLLRDFRNCPSTDPILAPGPVGARALRPAMNDRCRGCRS